MDNSSALETTGPHLNLYSCLGWCCFHDAALSGNPAPSDLYLCFAAKARPLRHRLPVASLLYLSATSMPGECIPAGLGLTACSLQRVARGLVSGHSGLLGRQQVHCTPRTGPRT